MKPAMKRTRFRHPFVFAFGAALLGVGLILGAWWWAERLERQRALRLAGAGTFLEAEPLLHQVLARSPDDYDVLRALAQGHLSANGAQEALDYANRCCALRPEEPEPFKL